MTLQEMADKLYDHAMRDMHYKLVTTHSLLGIAKRIGMGDPPMNKIINLWELEGRWGPEGIIPKRTGYLLSAPEGGVVPRGGGDDGE